MRPDLRDIEDCTPVFLSLFRFHDLDREIPDRILSPRNCVEKFLVMVVWVAASETSSLCWCHVCHTLLRAKVELAIFERTVRGNEFERVHTKSSDTADGGRNTSRTEEVEERMGALRMMYMKVPKLRG